MYAESFTETSIYFSINHIISSIISINSVSAKGKTLCFDFIFIVLVFVALMVTARIFSLYLLFPSFRLRYKPSRVQCSV